MTDVNYQNAEVVEFLRTPIPGNPRACNCGAGRAEPLDFDQTVGVIFDNCCTDEAVGETAAAFGCKEMEA